MDSVLSELVPARVRAGIYLLTVMLAAAWAVMQAHVDMHWGWQAGYAAWNALAGTVAVSNVTRAKAAPDA